MSTKRKLSYCPKYQPWRNKKVKQKKEVSELRSLIGCEDELNKSEVIQVIEENNPND